MEAIWDDLTSDEKTFEAPAWHEDIHLLFPIISIRSTMILTFLNVYEPFSVDHSTTRPIAAQK